MPASSSLGLSFSPKASSFPRDSQTSLTRMSFWQSTGKVMGALREHVDGWAEVRRAPFSPLGADVPEL